MKTKRVFQIIFHNNVLLTAIILLFIIAVTIIIVFSFLNMSLLFRGRSKLPTIVWQLRLQAVSLSFVSMKATVFIKAIP